MVNGGSVVIYAHALYHVSYHVPNKNIVISKCRLVKTFCYNAQVVFKLCDFCYFIRQNGTVSQD